MERSRDSIRTAAIAIAVTAMALVLFAVGQMFGIAVHGGDHPSPQPTSVTAHFAVLP